MSTSGGTATYSRQAFAVGTQIGDYQPEAFARIVTTGQTTVNDYTILCQHIEDVLTFAGSPVTVSFWARSGSGTPKIGVELQQQFGTGGSPSALANTHVGQVTLSTTWTRHSVSVTVPSIAGKTIGTAANTSSLRLNLWVSAGTNYAARTGAIGLQSNTFEIWGVQVERGSTVTDFELRPFAQEFAMCQRYYEKSYSYAVAPSTATYDGMQWDGALVTGFGTTTGNIFGSLKFLVPKRVVPSVTPYDGNGTAGVCSVNIISVGVWNNQTCVVDLLSDTGGRIYRSSGDAAHAIRYHYVAQAEY